MNLRGVALTSPMNYDAIEVRRLVFNERHKRFY